MGWTGVDPMKWAEETEARMQAVYRTSVDNLSKEMNRTKANGGRLPHKTGNLMRSLIASTAGPPSVGARNAKFKGSSVGLVTANLKLDQDIWIGWQANYAMRQNYGFVGKDSLGRTYNQQGSHFIEAAIAKWPQIVNDAATDIFKKVMSRAGR